MGVFPVVGRFHQFACWCGARGPAATLDDAKAQFRWHQFVHDPLWKGQSSVRVKR